MAGNRQCQLFAQALPLTKTARDDHPSYVVNEAPEPPHTDEVYVHPWIKGWTGSKPSTQQKAPEKKVERMHHDINEFLPVGVSSVRGGQPEILQYPKVTILAKEMGRSAKGALA